MRLPGLFYRLPLQFDASRLQQEVAQIEEEAWSVHPTGFAGNSALVLVSAGGTINNDFAIAGPMQPTRLLDRMPYVGQVLSALGVPVSRSRLMRIEGHGEVPEHQDVNYHWMRRTRLHIPIVTDPSVTFTCGDQSVHMAAGEAWTFDNFEPHHVTNPAATARIHLVVDTPGTPDFWDRLDPYDPDAQTQAPAPRFVPYVPGRQTAIETEAYRFDVLRPEEFSALLGDIVGSVDSPSGKARLRKRLPLIDLGWKSVFDEHGHDAAGEMAYARLIHRLQTDVRAETLGRRGEEAIRIISTMLATTGHAPRARKARPASPAAAKADEEPHRAAAPHIRRLGPSGAGIVQPVFIVSTPRAGSSLLFETLAQAPEVWTIGTESHALLEGIASLHPAARGFASNALTAADATPDVVGALRQRVLAQIRDRDGRRYRSLPEGERPGMVRLLEKTPKNALRLPLLKTAFPDALFVYLYREPRATIASLMEGWRSGRFVTYRHLPGWQGLPWSFLLPPGWEQMRDAPLVEITAFQWRLATTHILDALDTIPAADWTGVRYADLIADPAGVIRRLSRFAGWATDERMLAGLAAPLPPSRHTLTRADADKWRRHESALQTVLPGLRSLEERVATMLTALG